MGAYLLTLSLQWWVRSREDWEHKESHPVLCLHCTSNTSQTSEWFFLPRYQATREREPLDQGTRLGSLSCVCTIVKERGGWQLATCRPCTTNVLSAQTQDSSVTCGTCLVERIYDKQYSCTFRCTIGSHLPLECTTPQQALHASSL